MALEHLMTLSANRDVLKKGISKERIDAVLPELRKSFSFYREYPDLFVDFLCGHNPENFKLFFYQRVFLRICMRHKYVYATFPRAYSKSFLAILVLMLRCILFPGAKLFVTTGGKEQAASIAKEKVEELCKLIPGLKNEIDWRPGKTKSSKDMVSYVFKNNSILDIIAARASSRGKRKTGGLMEEVRNCLNIPFLNLLLRVHINYNMC